MLVVGWTPYKKLSFKHTWDFARGFVALAETGTDDLHTWDFARGFVALAETGTDDFDRILGDELDLELDPLAYPNQ